jgi:pyridoxal phosphate enzyme (YggS family)
LFEHIPKGLAEVRARMGEAAARSGRRLEDIRLVAVSKTHAVDAVRAAADAGQQDFGENKVQEALEKIEAAGRQVRWHLIGHLQSNKARKTAAFDYVHSIDSVDLLTRVDQAAGSISRQIEVLVQVDLALEPTKHGAPIDQIPSIFRAAIECRAARAVGLMLLPPLAENPEDARPWFARLRRLREELAGEGVPASQLRELSMGMSHDFEVAIEEGATMIRVGTAIFGQRA